MLRLSLCCTVCLVLMHACAPPVSTIPKRVITGLDSAEYAGIVESPGNIDLSGARFLAKVKVGDLGISLDCTYPDVLSLAKQKAQSIGGNLLVLTEHKQYQEKSKCHRIKGDIYAAPTLEGLESQIYWHPKRPLLAGDFRGRTTLPQVNSQPPVRCAITCRVGGDYFKAFILRTETIFWADSTFLPADDTRKAFALRRAQLLFDLAELHARQIKAQLVAFGPDLPTVTSKFRSITAQAQADLGQQSQSFNSELSGAGDAAAGVLERWENQVREEMRRLEPYFGDIRVDLRKKKK